MRILGIESSSLVASAAILTEDVITAEYTVNFKKTHSQTLLPMIDEIVRMTELDLNTIDAIAVSAGPGSFTGLRIGSATAKGLGLALKKPLISVSTIEAMAYQCYGIQKLICPIMDARRSQVYTGIYSFEGANFEERMKPSAIGIAELTEILKKTEKSVLFTGDGIPVYREAILEQLGDLAEFAPAFMNRQRAAAVAVLGSISFKKGTCENAADHQPEYLRKSQAEREREEKQKELEHDSAN